MSTNHWNRLTALFDQATQLPTDDHSRFVQKVVDDDPRPGGELEQLLIHDSPTDGALTDAVHSVAKAVGEAETTQRIGYRFGSNRQLEQTGRGGMGEAYLFRSICNAIEIAHRNLVVHGTANHPISWCQKMAYRSYSILVMQNCCNRARTTRL